MNMHRWIVLAAALLLGLPLAHARLDGAPADPERLLALADPAAPQGALPLWPGSVTFVFLGGAPQVFEELLDCVGPFLVSDGLWEVRCFPTVSTAECRAAAFAAGVSSGTVEVETEVRCGASSAACYDFQQHLAQCVSGLATDAWPLICRAQVKVSGSGFGVARCTDP